MGEQLSGLESQDVASQASQGGESIHRILPKGVLRLARLAKDFDSVVTEGLPGQTYTAEQRALAQHPRGYQMPPGRW